MRITLFPLDVNFVSEHTVNRIVKNSSTLRLTILRKSQLYTHNVKNYCKLYTCEEGFCQCCAIKRCQYTRVHGFTTHSCFHICTGA